MEELSDIDTSMTQKLTFSKVVEWTVTCCEILRGWNELNPEEQAQVLDITGAETLPEAIDVLNQALRQARKMVGLPK